ncbi:MAG: YCF48-related protein [Syntrophothermus sp.]
MKRLILLFVLLIYVLLPAQNGWIRQNPKPSEFGFEDVQFITSDIGFAVGSYNSVFKTTDSGKNWIEQNSEVSPPYSNTYIYFSKVSFVNEEIGMAVGSYYSTGSDENVYCIFKTTNGGNIWEFNSYGENVLMIDEYTAFKFKEYEGCMRTSDGGITWISTGFGFEQLSFSDSKNGAAIDCKIYITSDGGNTWITKYESYFCEFKYIQRIDSLNIIASGPGGKIMKSTDAGNTWHNQNSGTNKTLHKIVFKDINNGLIIGGLRLNYRYPSDSTNIVLKTTNGGENWSRQIIDSSLLIYSVSFSNKNNGIITGSYIADNPYDAKPSILRTTNGGINWSEQYKSYTEYSLNDINTIDENIYVAVGNKGIIIKTTNGGESWENKISGTQKNFNAVFFSDQNTGTVVGDSGLILKTTDGGTSWNVQNSNTYLNLNSVYFVNGSETGFITSNNNLILKTTNGGNIWDIKLNLPGSLFTDIFFVNENLGFVTGREYDLTSFIYMTTNGGASWRISFLGPEQNNSSMNGIYFTDALNGISVGGYWYDSYDPYYIYKTTDGGLTWNLKKEGTEYILNDVSFYDDIHGIAVGTSGCIFITSDGGENWELQYRKPGTQLNSVSVFNQGVSITVGQNGVILKNTNAILPVELSSFTAAHNKNNVSLIWRTTTETNNKGFYIQRKSSSGDYINLDFIQGKGTTTTPQNYSYIDNNVPSGKYTYRLMQIDFDGTFKLSNEIEVNISEVPKEFSLEQNYPNPFNPTTKINYSIAKEELTSLIIFDVLGNEIKKVINEVKPVGHYTIEFNASELPSGIYFYQLKSGSFSSTKKMIVMK